MKSIHNEPLFQPYWLGDMELTNRVIMSSMTRGRADNLELTPTALHAQYYAQRATAGLIITESVWVSKSAIGYINLPGIYTKIQTEAWKQVVQAVHEKKGKVFVQLAHSGSVSHPDFLDGKLPLGPSAINPMEKAYTPSGFKDTKTPEAYTHEQIRHTIAEFKQASANALEAGFDGIEIHAQLFTLIPQFMSAYTNQRTDEYGGSIENRCRFLFELLSALEEVWSSNRIGIKFTPAAFNSGLIRPDKETLATYDYLLKKLNLSDLAYVHIVAPVNRLKDTVLDKLDAYYFAFFRNAYKGTLIANGGFTRPSGNKILYDDFADLVSYATLYIANPDLVERFQLDLPLSVADKGTYYSGGEKGFTDYESAKPAIQAGISSYN